MGDVNRAVPTDLTCYDCGRPLLSTVRNGWAGLAHADGDRSHPVRILAHRPEGVPR